MKPRSRKTWTRILDQLWRDAIRKRDQMQCRRCGGTSYLQAAHIHSRNFRSTRWDTDNGLLLCAGCHHWAHLNPTAFAKFVTEQIGQKMVDFLMRRAAEPQHITEPWLQDIEQQLRSEQ